jgi:DNA polymerase-3 subunit delta
MQLNTHQLSDNLAGSLAPVYLIHGDEILLTDEACQLVRDQTSARGFSERQVFTVEKGFDWQSLGGYAQSLSLFAEKRLLELRLPTGKPGTAGAAALQEYVGRPSDDTVLLIWSGRLDKKTQTAKWVQALDSVGVVVTIYPPSKAELPGWIGQRLHAQGLEPGDGVAEMLAYRYEGNLLACSQEVEKLSLLLGQGSVTLADIEGKLGDNARFDVFGLVDLCLQGDAAAAVRALQGLRAEGTGPVLILWALAREIRSLTKMANDLAAGKAEQQVFRDYRVWARRQSLVRSALKRHSLNRWYALLQASFRADKVIKGRERGEAWQALQALGLAFCGVRFSRAS